jgi:hypothetical protein
MPHSAAFLEQIGFRAYASAVLDHRAVLATSRTVLAADEQSSVAAIQRDLVISDQSTTPHLDSLDLAGSSLAAISMPPSRLRPANPVT